MTSFTEQREYFRMRIDCDIHCKQENSTEIHIARCISLSGAGVSFVTTQSYEIGEQLDVTIHPQHDLTPPMRGKIKVIRMIPLENDEFEVGASMQVLED